jgi:hypothetical protein
MTGGGCLNEGSRSNQKNHTFGGNVGPPPSGSWEHVVRKGNNIEFNFHSWDAQVDSCWLDAGDGPCSPAADFNNITWSGTGKYSLGNGSRTEDATFTAHVEDRGEPGNHNGPCGSKDFYEITVYSLSGAVVFQASGYLDCGNLQLHKGTPSSTRGAGADALIDGARLGLATPNPFRNATSISYAVEGTDAQAIDISVYDISGRVVRRLESGILNPGQYETVWDGRNDDGATVARGMYFVRVISGSKQATTRVMFLK